MKLLTTVVFTLSLLVNPNQIFSAPLYSASVTVYDQSGQPLAGVPIRMELHTTTTFAWDVRTTDANGYVYIPLTAPGFLEYMVVRITNQSYVILSQQGTSTETSIYLYPTFNVGLDIDGNDIIDGWEMPLAQKFCPVLFQPKDDNGSHWNASGVNYTLRPVPVEAMDSNGDGILNEYDVQVLVYNANLTAFVGRWRMEELTVGGTPYTDKYPDWIKPAYSLTFQPPGKAYAQYVVMPHYDWATTDNYEGNVSWYERWNELYDQEAIQNSNTWYFDGTIYAFFEQPSGGNAKIIYTMHYPFNASANRHEGDWPSIVVELDTQNPNNANIVSVSYSFHGEQTVRTTMIPYTTSGAEALYQEEFIDDGNSNPAFANKYFIINGTHPVSFGGGRLDELGFEGWGSHAQYPCPGIWIRQEVTDIEEYVVENGSIANETLFFDFNNYQNIKILPPRQYVVDNLILDPEYNWVIFGGFWGAVFSYPSIDNTPVLNFWNAFSALLTGWSFGLLYPVLPQVPNINIAPLSPYGGSLGW